MTLPKDKVDAAIRKIDAEIENNPDSVGVGLGNDLFDALSKRGDITQEECQAVGLPSVKTRLAVYKKKLFASKVHGLPEDGHVIGKPPL